MSEHEILGNAKQAICLLFILDYYLEVLLTGDALFFLAPTP